MTSLPVLSQGYIKIYVNSRNKKGKGKKELRLQSAMCQLKYCKVINCHVGRLVFFFSKLSYREFVWMIDTSLIFKLWSYRKKIQEKQPCSKKRFFNQHILRSWISNLQEKKKHSFLRAHPSIHSFPNLYPIVDVLGWQGGVLPGQVTTWSQSQQTNEVRQYLFLLLRVELFITGFGMDRAWLAVSPSLFFSAKIS